MIVSPAQLCGFCLALGAVVGCTADGGKARVEIPTLEARRLTADAVKIDGALGEDAWQTAATTEEFVDPSTGRKRPSSGVKARAQVAWDAEWLYLAAVVRDKKPQSPFKPGERDPHIWEKASAVELMIQPGDLRDNRDYYEIQVDVAGAVWDTHFDDYNRPITGSGAGKRFGHQDWESNIRQAVSIDRSRGRYTVEAAIPWSALFSQRTASPPQVGDVWRINLYSFRDGQRDSLAWSPILREGNFHRASRFGRVVFVE